MTIASILNFVGLITCDKFSKAKPLAVCSKMETAEEWRTNFRLENLHLYRARSQSKGLGTIGFREGRIFATLRKKSKEFEKLERKDQLYLVATISKIPKATLQVCETLTTEYNSWNEASFRIDTTKLLEDIYLLWPRAIARKASR